MYSGGKKNQENKMREKIRNRKDFHLPTEGAGDGDSDDENLAESATCIREENKEQYNMIRMKSLFCLFAEILARPCPWGKMSDLVRVEDFDGVRRVGEERWAQDSLPGTRN